MLHIPILRQGKAYRSLDVARVAHYRTREAVAEVSQANVGLIRRDLSGQDGFRKKLAGFSCAELLEICARAAEHFLNDALPLGEASQTPQEYVEQVSGTTGLPYVLVRRNMQKISAVLGRMRSVVDGLTRGLDLRVLDEGRGETRGQALSFFPRGATLGVVLPSNSPGVHSLWAPAIALKTPLVLKPGSAEPWTPYRMLQALARAGCPGEALNYYPADHAGAGEILRMCGRGMVFGDTASVGQWAHDPRIEVHGPGNSKIVFGRDTIDEWEKHMDVMAASVAENSGRSCINASGIWVPARAQEIAEALAERLARIEPRAADDEEAQLAPFADVQVAARISAAIDDGLEEPGARDVSAARRGGGRLVTWQGSTYLLPTIIHCAGPGHPLANREFLFPFASVVEVDEDELPECLGPSLVVSAITEDRRLLDRLLASPLVGRLNLGSLATNRVSWDQPHEGNLFDHLYARRAIQSAAAVAAWP